MSMRNSSASERGASPGRASPAATSQEAAGRRPPTAQRTTRWRSRQSGSGTARTERPHARIPAPIRLHVQVPTRATPARTRTAGTPGRTHQDADREMCSSRQHAGRRDGQHRYESIGIEQSAEEPDAGGGKLAGSSRSSVNDLGHRCRRLRPHVVTRVRPRMQ